MRAINKLFAAAAVAGGLMAIASSASAEVVAAYTPPPAGGVATLDWTNVGGTGGVLSADTIVEFDFGAVFPTLFPLWDIAADFTLVGTVVGTPALLGMIQTDVDNGAFEFRYHDSDTSSAVDAFGSFNLTDGDLLFGGTFNDAMITRAPNTATVLSTTSVAFYSPFISQNMANGAFSLSITEVTPGNTTGAGEALSSFSGPSSGVFSAVVPEPGTWALMIMGFGGAGAMLRSRRRAAAFA